MPAKTKVVKSAIEKLVSLDIDDLDPFQRNLKDLTQANYEKLKARILDLDYSEPIVAWKDKTKTQIINGHQRVRTLKRMREEGFSIPKLPVILIKAKNKTEAKKKVLSLTSQFGSMTFEGLQDFADDAGLELEEINKAFHFPEVDLDSIMNEDLGEDESKDNHEYTSKIDTPVYKPTGEKPKVSELFDTTKMQELVLKIDKAKIDSKLKEFLTLAAQRHNVFDYRKIAEFYSHADKKTQELFEDSVLVIIDFEKAIEKGFVKLTKDLAEQYEST